MKRIRVGDSRPAPGARNTVGGCPILRSDQQIPVCAICGSRMALILQCDLPEDSTLGLHAGSHFLAFTCPFHDEINVYCSDGERPPEFWDKETGRFRLILNPTGGDEWIGDEDPYLEPRELIFEDARETEENLDGVASGSQQFKLGGEPTRMNNQITAVCGCGSPMDYFLEIPDGFGFQKQTSAPEQPNSFSTAEYCLFLGNCICFLACEAQCHPLAVTAILDH